MIKLEMKQEEYLKAIEAMKIHPLYKTYKVKAQGFKPMLNALNEVYVEAYFTTKSKSDQRNVDLFENLLNSFEGYKEFCKVTCGNVSLEN